MKGSSVPTMPPCIMKCTHERNTTLIAGHITACAASRTPIVEVGNKI